MYTPLFCSFEQSWLWRRLSVVAGNLLVLFCATLASSVSAFSNETIIYQTDFSTDPGWITDQSENFYWDEDREALFVRTMNKPAATNTKSRYAYKETTLNARQSYSLAWDMNILGVSPDGNSSGVAVFGLYGDNLYGFNPLGLNFAGTEQDGSFSIRLMTLDGLSNQISTTINPGYNLDTTINYTRTFALNRWYRFVLRYDAPALRYYFTMSDRDSGQILFATSILDTDPDPVNPALQNVGITMHPEGAGSTRLNTPTRLEGFAEYLVDNVVLTQIFDETYTEPPSVLFLPGIQASRLYTEGLFGSEDRLWEPNNKEDVRQLAMTEDGESIESIYTNGALGAIFGVTDIYAGFETYLDSLQSNGTISDWLTFAYDWRYAVDDVVADGTRYENDVKSLVETVEQLARTNNSKVAIVAHSNGGLLAKALMLELEDRNKTALIDQIIFVASPQLGTPKAIGSLLHGYDQQQLHGWLIDEVTARDVLKNMPAVYGLLPSTEYLAGGETIVSFASASITAPFIDAYGSEISTYSKLVEFLLGERDGRRDAEQANEVGRANQALIEKAIQLHEKLTNWRAPQDIPVTEIVGVGFDTVKGFRYEEFTTKDCVLMFCTDRTYYEPVAQFTQYGDETVVAKSAEGYEGVKTVYYVDLDALDLANEDQKISHSNLLSSNVFQSLIKETLQKTAAQLEYISSSLPTYGGVREVISVHSPVTISAVDASGRVVGRQESGKAPVVEIPGASYHEIGGAKYLVLPKSATYEVMLRGEGEAVAGYTLTIHNYTGDSPAQVIARYDNATVAPSMVTAFTKTTAGFSDLSIDYDGDGAIDEMRTLSGDVPVYVYYEEVRSIIADFSNLKDSERSWLLKAVDRAERTGVRKGEDAAGVVRILGQVDGRLVQYFSEGRITKESYDKIKYLFTEILN